MEAGLEHFDMGLVNYRQHPSNVNYIVYRFKDLERANTFEEKLAAAKIWFERSNPDADEKQYYIFAVEKKHYNKSQRINFETEAKHKKHLIPHNFWRTFFVLFMLSLIVLASIGYCKSRKVLEDATKNINASNKNVTKTLTLRVTNTSFKQMEKQ